jgi:hypothetical protein
LQGARPIKASKMKNYRGNFPSQKCGTMVKYESLLERDYIQLLEFDSAVEYFESQPLKIPYMYKGVEHVYYPDFKVLSHENRVTLVEVKPEKFLKKEENLVKFEVGKQFCEENNWVFLVISEDKIRVGHLQYNLKKLRNANFQSMSTGLKNTIIHKVKDLGNIKIGSIIEELDQFNKQEVYSHLYSLIYNHQLYTELINYKLSNDSIIKIC